MSKFMYLRSTRNEQPIGCVAFHAEGDTLAYQFSVWNPSDKFDRSLGRKIAGGRLEKTPIMVEVPGVSGLSHHEVITAVMACMAATPDAPGRAVKVAKLWLEKNVH